MAEQPTPSRMEAFSDGVIAVIITIMVLELHVAQAPGMAGFLTVLPSLGVYALSFIFSGIYWVNHHHLVDRLHHIDHLILWANLLFLFFLSLLPFFTKYLVERLYDPTSVRLYALSLAATALAFQALSFSIASQLRRDRQSREAAELRDDRASLDRSPDRAPADQHGRAEPPADRYRHRAELGKGWISLAFYLLAVLIAPAHRHIALTAVAVVTLIWITPGFGLKPARSQTEAVPGP